MGGTLQHTATGYNVLIKEKIGRGTYALVDTLLLHPPRQREREGREGKERGRERKREKKRERESRREKEREGDRKREKERE